MKDHHCITCNRIVKRREGQKGPLPAWCPRREPEEMRHRRQWNARYWAAKRSPEPLPPRVCLGHAGFACTEVVTGRTQKRCASCMPLYREEYQKAWQATHPQKPKSQRVSRVRARPEPDYTVPPTSRQSATSPVRMSDTAHCRAKRKDVTAKLCIESYTDVNALGRQSSACYRCKAGRDLRALYAGGAA